MMRRVLPQVRRGLRQRPASTLPVLDASRLTVSRTTTPKPLPELAGLQFGAVQSDHMLEVDWSAAAGWSAPSISPTHPLSLDPAASCLHYGLQVRRLPAAALRLRCRRRALQAAARARARAPSPPRLAPLAATAARPQAFEGMKAYADSDGELRLFRPELNMARLGASMTTLSMPPLDGAAFLECIKALVRLDRRWVPRQRGFSLYLRPTVIATWPYLGVSTPLSLKLFVITCPVRRRRCRAPPRRAAAAHCRRRRHCSPPPRPPAAHAR